MELKELIEQYPELEISLRLLDQNIKLLESRIKGLESFILDEFQRWCNTFTKELQMNQGVENYVKDVVKRLTLLEEKNTYNIKDIYIDINNTDEKNDSQV